MRLEFECANGKERTSSDTLWNFRRNAREIDLKAPSVTFKGPGANK